MPTTAEGAPLLPSAFLTSTRVHYLDNLRTTLVVLLIFHHAAITSATLAYYPSERAFLGVFTTTNKAFLWSTFYLLSGFSSSLALSASASDIEFLKRRTLPLALQAFAWYTVGRVVVAWILTSGQGWRAIFGEYTALKEEITGPATYVAFLVIMDGCHIGLRSVRTPQVPQLLGRSRHLSSLLLPVSAFVFLLICTYANTYPNRVIPFPSFLDSLISSFDYPLPDAPLSCIISYMIGANWIAIKETLPTTISSPTFLPTSLGLSYLFLGVSQALSSAISSFINPKHITPPALLRMLLHAGLNAHTFAFVLWDALTALVLPICLVSFFSSTSVLRKSWSIAGAGGWRKGYVLTYIHMVLVLFSRWWSVRVGMGMYSAIFGTLSIGALSSGMGWVGISAVELGVRKVMHLAA